MIVVGLGFGDEGKGLTTSFLASRKENPIVIRFNGGHQAGHTVVHNNYRHVFSSFNAATLQGVPTYWSKYCTFYPDAFLNEYKALAKNYKKEISYYIHALAPVTTPFDIIANREFEQLNKHGSVGVGFGKTIQRHESYFKLYVRDLYYEDILRSKLESIATLYYKIKDSKKIIEKFCKTVKEVLPKISLISNDIDEFELLDQLHDDVIFEGAQGIMLDMDFGFFPNVTRSNTTSKNAIQMLKTDNIISNNDNVEIYYVTRTYQTRHGNGYMSNEKLPTPILINNELETNKSHEYQGEFRKTVLDIDMLNYAIECDSHFSTDLEKNLVITCVDQTGEDFDVTEKGILKKINVKDLASKLIVKFKKVYASYGDDLTKIKELK